MSIAERPRDFVGVRGPDAEDFLQRMLSNDVTTAPCDALLLTPKGRIIAPLRVLRRGEADFLLLTEPGLGETVRETLRRARFAAKCEIEPERHTSVLVWDGDFSEAAERVDEGLEPTASEEELERARIEAGVPAWGKELDENILPAEAGLDRTHISFSKGCYPGQEPVARLHYRGHANRGLRVLREDARPGAEIRYDGKVVGRITSAVSGVALAYVRANVPEDAELSFG
ncbi:MAG: folate-binding protein YgfZ [Actinobacteria bacterium]|nr:folate-binding protein YgfZ [Actinomycetota bacterium]